MVMQILLDDFIADGGEQFITIGNSFNNNETNALQLNDNVTFNSSYYYFDNIRLEKCSSTGISAIDPSSIVVFPNPASQAVFMDSPIGSHWSIFDGNGKRIKSGYSNSSREMIDASLMASGLYLLSIVYEGKHYSKKIVISK